MAAFNLRRPTRDIDLQTTSLPNDIDTVVARVREVVAVDVGDGLTFDPDDVRAGTIRDEDPYAGVRIRLVGVLGRSRLSIGIDINFGDPIMPPPTEITLPRLLQTGQEPVHMMGYPLSMVIAEKAVTAIERGEANTRWRDFADMLAISNQHHMMASELSTALNTVADYRGAPLTPLLPALAPMADIAQTKWINWRHRQEHADTLPDQFSALLEQLAAFIDPVLDAILNPVSPMPTRWNPASREWEN